MTLSYAIFRVTRSCHTPSTDPRRLWGSVRRYLEAISPARQSRYQCHILHERFVGVCRAASSGIKRRLMMRSNNFAIQLVSEIGLKADGQLGRTAISVVSLDDWTIRVWTPLSESGRCCVCPTRSAWWTYAPDSQNKWTRCQILYIFKFTTYNKFHTKINASSINLNYKLILDHSPAMFEISFYI